ncbi:MAG: PepSY domain-containing protein [Marinibacterium sp.]
MRKFALLAAIMLATPALAGGLAKDMVLGTTMEKVQSSLTDMGYDVRKAEMEDGEIEVYAVKGSQMAEVYVDPQTGKIVKIKTN